MVISLCVFLGLTRAAGFASEMFLSVLLQALSVALIWFLVALLVSALLTRLDYDSDSNIRDTFNANRIGTSRVAGVGPDSAADCDDSRS